MRRGGSLLAQLVGQRDGLAGWQQLQLRRWRSFGHNGRGEKRTIKSGLFLSLSGGGGHCGDFVTDNVREYSIHPQNPLPL